MAEFGTLRPDILVMLLAAALATWATRFGGVWLVRRIPLGPRWQAALAALPGAILAALVAPAAIQGVAEASATVATILMARRFPAVVAIMLGIAIVILMRFVSR